MRRLTLIGGSLAVLLVLLASIASWLVYAESGTAALLAMARRYLPASLTLGEVSGALGRELRVNGLRYHDADAGVELTVDSLTVALAPLALVTGRVHLREVLVRGAALTLSPPRQPAAPEVEGKPLDPPLDMVIDGLRLQGFVLRRSDADPFVVDRAELGGAWTHAGIHLQKLDVSAPAGRVHANGQLRTSTPWLENITADIDWTVDDQRWRATVTGAVTGGKLHLSANTATPLVAELLATVAMDEHSAWQATLTVPRFDPRARLLPGSSVTSLHAALKADGDAGSARLQGVLGIDDQLIHVVDLVARRNGDSVELPAIKLRLGDQPGLIDGHAVLSLGEPLRGSAKIAWEEISLPPRWLGPSLSAAGELTFAGSAQRFAASAHSRLNRAGQHANLDLRLAGSTHSLQIEQLELTQGRGELSVTGRLELDAPLRWQLDAVARNFDPGTFAADWRGALQFRLDTRGEWPSAGPRASLRLDGLEGTLRGRAITGGGELTLERDMRIAGQLRVRSGQTSLEVSSPPGATPQLDATLSIAALADWRQDLRGSLTARVHATGKWPATSIEASIDARDIRSGENLIDSAGLTLKLRNPRDPEGTVNLRATGVAAGGFRFDRIETTLAGTRRAHTLGLNATGTPLSTSLEAAGSVPGSTWSGTIGALKIAITDVPALELESPAHLSVGKESFDLQRSCLAGGKIGLCVAASHDSNGNLSANYSIRELPLQLIARLAARDAPVGMLGTANGSGTLERRAGGRFSGTAELNAARGSIVQGEGDAQLRVDYANLGIEVRIDDGAARAGLHGSFPEHGELKGELTVDDLRDRQSPLHGSAQVTLRNLAPVAWLIPQLASIEGNGELAATITGTLAAPEFAANLQLQRVKTELPALGITLTDGEFRAALDAGGATRLTGKVSSGGGMLELSGGGESLDALALRINGHDFLLADIPGVRLVITPDLELKRAAPELVLTGSVTLPSADLDLGKLSAGGGESVSSDVVVVDREQAQSEPMAALRADVKVILGEQVKLVGYGLDTMVSGELRIDERPEYPSTGSGEIRLAGTYEAYGRKLSIERGRLQFAATPLDNPQLDILATRELTDVTAKLRVTGTAKRPQLSVFTDPATSQTDAMSYLLTGKPASALSGEDGKEVESAAQSLGGILGDRLAKKMGPKLGLVDTVGVEQSEELGGSAFTVGKYLSPKFYVSYGVGLFEPGRVVTLRYVISKHWAIEANQAPEDQRAGIHYRIER